MSDSHDNVPLIKKAVDYFNKKNVEAVFHAGDFISPFCAKEFKNLTSSFIGVFGNNDGERKMWYENLNGWGKISEGMAEETIGGVRFLVMHEPRNLEALAKSGKYDVIVFGHTHRPEHRKIGQTLLVNPGECGGWLTGRAGVAVLETPALKLDFVTLS